MISFLFIHIQILNFFVIKHKLIMIVFSVPDPEPTDIEIRALGEDLARALAARKINWATVIYLMDHSKKGRQDSVKKCPYTSINARVQYIMLGNPCYKHYEVVSINLILYLHV